MRVFTHRQGCELQAPSQAIRALLTAMRRAARLSVPRSDQPSSNRVRVEIFVNKIERHEELVRPD